MSSPFSFPPIPPATAAQGHHPSRLADALIHELVGPPPHSIHAILGPRLRAAEGGNTAALTPTPIVNGALRRLVSLVTIGEGTETAGVRAVDLTDRATAGRELLAEVEAKVRSYLDADPVLAGRAADLRQVAGLAETELERHHALRLLAKTGTGKGHGAPTTHSTLEQDMGGFPYVENYRLLVSAELHGMASFKRPRRLTFCGAGALPLTGILAHQQSGATVRLIEIDAETARLARAVVRVLERLRIITAGHLRVDIGDAGTIDLSDTDVVVIASLIPAETVRNLVARLSRLPDDRRPILVVRSANGLVGHFAYAPVEPATVVAAGGYRHVGTVAPAGREPSDGQPLLARADRSVLNTSEYFLPQVQPFAADPTLPSGRSAS